MTGTLRDAVRSAVGGVLFNAMNYPERVQHLMLGQDISPLTQKVTDAVLAALSQQRPDAAVLREHRADWWGECTCGRWQSNGEEGTFTDHQAEQIAALPPQTHRMPPRSDQDGSVGTDDRAGRNGEPQ